MRYILILAVLAATVLGCARDVGIPTLPDTSDPSGALQAQTPYDLDNGPYRLWGEWLFYIDESHENIDVVPARNGRIHLNALKFLEETCTNCLQITGIHNNGDGTIDLTVRITHPFPGMPQFTGFDVKGIIMFQGSHEFYRPDHGSYKYPLIPQPYHVSWRLLGDPELLNADGYSFRWSPWYDSGSSLPIFNYWPGKYSSGTPSANINAFRNFYSNEERHMFEHDASVTRTYHISLPPGPVIAGYAIEACWEPPIKFPVTDPVEDFPITANQPEAYRFHCVINDGETITLDNQCCGDPESVYKARAEMDFWYLMPEAIPDLFFVGHWSPEMEVYQGKGYATSECDGPTNWRCMLPFWYLAQPDGTYQFMAFLWYVWDYDPPIPYIAVDVYEVEVDMK